MAVLSIFISFNNMGKIRQKVKEALALVKEGKVGVARVRRTNKVILAEQRKKEKYERVCKILDLITKGKEMEVINHLGEFRYTRSEFEGIYWEKLAREGFKADKMPEDLFIQGGLSLEVLKRIYEDFLLLNPSFRKK